MSWSKRYKKSIDCNNPKGFSQKAHCAGRKARQAGKSTKSKSVSEMTIEEKLELFLEKNCPTDKAKWAASKAAAKAKFDVYPSAYANGWAAKNYKSKGGGWRKCKNESVINENGCWEGYKQVGMKDKGGKMVPNCVPVNEDMHELNCDENGNCWEMDPPRYQSTSMGYREMELEEEIEEYDVETLEELKDFAKYIKEYTQLLSEATCPCLLEAEYRGRKVRLGKIMQGDVKKFKVYVKNDKGNVVKVNFGFGGSSAKGKRMTIKKNNPERRKNFRARHNCDNPGPRWKARYWACRTW
ncbi:hypothetical protein UFOVP449_91 [uncultured Caudovirales phage]|uniref:Uncharacterized protein n=1 Tax=uncultured Caudovirales phage TaxID=2100421 RepID=A0A6J5M9Y1_9CAUD|nr:hypothetical protein UFOVP449_91 [uncultured Caudovirales phage]